MDSPSVIYTRYRDQLEDLKTVVSDIEQKTISENPEPFFVSNVNFLTKSFLVNICAHLESFIKDVIFECIQDIDNKLSHLQIPHNLVQWSLNRGKDSSKIPSQFTTLAITIKKKHLDDYISGSPFRTVTLFEKVGINLSADEDFQSYKDRINMIVVKRNKVLHHNDTASDLTFEDLKEYISSFKEYMLILDQSIRRFTFENS